MKTFKRYITEAATSRRKLWVFDFDDTLAVDDTPVDVVDSTGKVVRQVSSLQFKSDSLKDGERYDFGNQARNPKPRGIPATLKIMRRVVQKGRTVVLTARADGEGIQKWLRGIGIDVEVVPVGKRARGHDGIAREKRDWLAGEIAKGYNDIEVFEDNALNLKQMKTLARPGTVRLRGRLVRYSPKPAAKKEPAPAAPAVAKTPAKTREAPESGGDSGRNIEPGSTWETKSGVFGGKNRDGTIRYFEDERKAQDWARGQG